MAEHLPFNGLRVFEAAARHLSFRRAAEELHVTPAAISQQIRGLEGQLGVQLFHRFNRTLALTGAGQAGLRRLQEGFDHLAEAVQQIKARDAKASLTVWMAPSFAAKWLVPRLHGFTALHPGIDMRVSASTELIDAGHSSNTIPAESFRRNSVDLAIRFGNGDYPGCRVDKLLSVSAVPLCSPRLLEGSRPLERPDDLRHHTLLHDDTVYEGRPDWATWLKAAGVARADATRGLHFNHVSLALEAAIDGQGVVLSLEPLAADDLAAGRLVIPFDLSLPLQYAYHVISLEETAEQPNVAAFREWLMAEASEERDKDEHLRQPRGVWRRDAGRLQPPIGN